MRPKAKYQIFVEQTTLVAVANKIRACEICSQHLFNPVFVVPQVFFYKITQPLVQFTLEIQRFDFIITLEHNSSPLTPSTRTQSLDWQHGSSSNLFLINVRHFSPFRPLERFLTLVLTDHQAVTRHGKTVSDHHPKTLDPKQKM